MIKGGYKVIDLHNIILSDTPTTIEGIYEDVMTNYEKMLLISGMAESGVLYDDMPGFAFVDDGNLAIIVGNKKLTISADDAVTITAWSGGGGGSVEVVDNLNSTSATKALSAKQGKVLKEMVDEKLDADQGSENAGKYMKVESDGSVGYGTPGGGGGTEYIAGDGIDITNDTISVDDSIARVEDIPDSYTKSEEDTLLSEKADSDDVYTKSAVDDYLALKADKNNTYTKTEVDDLLPQWSEEQNLLTGDNSVTFDDLDSTLVYTPYFETADGTSVLITSTAITTGTTAGTKKLIINIEAILAAQVPCKATLKIEGRD